ncbi:MAG: hypothetical protein ACKPHU_22525, partial [Planctomycetaceae bacterium]
GGMFWAVAVASDSSRMAVESEMCGVVFMAGKLGVISGAVAGGGGNGESGWGASGGWRAGSPSGGQWSGELRTGVRG